MNTISNRALISRLYKSAEDHLKEVNIDAQNWTSLYTAVQDLTVPEKMVFIVVKLNQKVTHGGLSEFYHSPYGMFAPEIIHVFNEIKALASADIIASSLNVVNPIELLDPSFKAFIFNIKLTDHQRSQLFQLDIRYDNLQDIENLEDLLGNYLQTLVG